MRLPCSLSAKPEARTYWSTSGFRPASQRVTPCSARLRSLSINIWSAEYSISKTAAQIQQENAGPRLRYHLADAIGDLLRVDEEEPAFRPHDQQPIEGLVIRMFRGERAEGIPPRLRPTTWIRGFAA